MGYETSLEDYLDGFFAYDLGCTSSGILDNVKRQEISESLLSLSPLERQELLNRIGQELYGVAPYTDEDLEEWQQWCKDQGWVL